MRTVSNRWICLAACLCLLAVSGAAQQRNPLPVPDIPGYKTLKCDFHMHTVFSDGEVWPTTRVNEAWRQGLDAIAITDHAGYNPNKADVPPDLTRPHALASALAARLGILLAPAVEVMKGDTHFNVLFVSNQNAFMGLDLPDALREGRKQNGFTFWNHPGWKQPTAWFPDVAALYDEKLVDGVELVNGGSYYPQAFPWIEEKKLTILSTTDVHAPAPASWDTGGRTMTLVFARTPDLEGIREAMFARRTAAWMGGELWGNEAHLRGLYDGAVVVETPELKFGPNLRQLTLRVRNNSALRFQLRLTKAPAWMTVGGAELRPEGGAGISVRLNKEAPAGTQSVELEFEAANLHVAPGRNLSVRVPLKVVVAQ